MKRFVDRESELEFLNKEYNRKGSSLVILYGRRRVGKTALANEFIKNKDAIYFLATEENEMQNCNEFKNVVAQYLKNYVLKSIYIDNWEFVFEEILKNKYKGKMVIVIDEFQYIGKSNPAFISKLQKIWDTMLKDKNIMLILTGSFISMIESQALNYSSPLYGRRTGQIKLKQIPFKNYNEFYNKKDRKELIEYYAITGGIPKYIELFYESKNIYQAIRDNILSKSSFLYDEPYFLLQKEVVEVGSYFSIIRSIAAGNQKLSKIATDLEIKQTSLTKYLKVLIDLDILERIVPVTEENPEKSKKGLYRIKDNFIKFWFGFIYPNLSYVESGNEKIVLDRIRNNLVDNHISYVYEDICTQKMWDLSSDIKWEFMFDKIGKWWNSNNEIDIIAIDQSGKNIVFGECKYWNNKVGVNVLKELERKSNLVEWNKDNRKNYYILFSINGFTKELEELSKVRNDIKLCN